MLKASKLRPFVPSGPDYPRARQFFQDLGFETIYSADDLTVFRIDEQEFFLQNYNDRHFAENYMLELIVEDLDGWWEHIKKTIIATYQIRAKPPIVQPWGKRELVFIDLAGVCWHISEPVA